MTDAIDNEDAEARNVGVPNPSQSKSRSETPYPYYGLSKVIEIAQAVRRAGGNDAAPAASVATELGISKMADRVWAYGIPAATHFGLVERLGRGEDAKVKLTDLGLRIVLPGTPEEEKASKLAAFRTPELYSKLLERFSGNPVPSKDILRRLLERDFKIVESMAGNAAEAFLDSLKVAELISASNTISVAGTPSAPIEERSKPADENYVAAPGMKTVSVPADYVIYKCKISKGQILEIPLPRQFRKMDVERLHAFLLTQMDEEEGD